MPDFANIKQVADYLVAAGYQVGKSTVYNHRKAGKLPCRPDGTFSARQVKAYAETYLKKTGAVMPEVDQAKAIAEEKAAADARKAAAQATHWETKTKQLLGELVPRSEYARQIAARSALFRSDMEAFCLSIPAEVVGIVGGDPVKIPDLQAFLLQKMSALLGRYARDMEFKLEETG